MNVIHFQHNVCVCVCLNLIFDGRSSSLLRENNRRQVLKALGVNLQSNNTSTDFILDKLTVSSQHVTSG